MNISNRFKLLIMKNYCLSIMFFMIIFCFSTASAQTIYKDEPGFYTPVIKSLFVRSGFIEDVTLVGPALGYRFNGRYDISLHTEYISSKFKLDSGANPETTLLNLGLTAGRTDYLSEQRMLRSEASVYQAVSLKLENYGQRSDPSLTSGLISSSFYQVVSLSKKINLLPNIGVFSGYGSYTAPAGSANLRQSFDGFIAGPRLGLDLSYQVSEAFSITANPEINFSVFDSGDDTQATLLFNLLLNF